MSKQRFRTIVVDPPWDHSDGTGVHVESGRTTGPPYSAMTQAEIAELPIPALADWGAHLYLWTTSRYLPVAFDLVDGWGFDYVAPLVWCKSPRGFSTGGAFQNNVEFVLFCRRRWSGSPDVHRLTTVLAEAAEKAGLSHADVDQEMGTSDMAGWWLSRLPHRCQCPRWDQWLKLKALVGLGDEWDAEVQRLNAAKTGAPPQAINSRWFQWPRGAHSAKPDAFFDLVEQVSPPPYLEMFARRARLGWDYAGDESLGTVELEGLAS